MSMGAGERAGARLLQQSASTPLSRAQLPSSAAPTKWIPSRMLAADHSHGPPGENLQEQPTSSSTWKEEHVDKTLLRFLVGRGGSTKEKLEKDNGVRLTIPSNYEARSRSSVMINGSEASIKAASTAIQKILDDAVQSKLQYTHFISLPLALHPALLEQVANFQQSILASLESSSNAAGSSSSDDENADSSGIHKSIFVKPATFHLTILMLKLWNEERIQAASNVLQKIMPFVHKVLEGQPLAVNLQGIECLRGTSEKAHVLYARIEDSKYKTRLLQACQVLIDAFVESGLVLEKDVGQSLTLHATLMNTANRKKKKGQWSSKRVPFDARDILAKYGNWNWGEYPILEAHLSERFVYDENGYYHCVSAILFPQLPS